MAQRGRNEGPELRRWDRDVVADSDIDEERTWVVWGLGSDPSEPGRAAAPEEEARGRPGNDIAGRIAASADPEWGRAPEYERWVVLLDADEDDVDEWASEDGRVRGYAAYLLQATDASTEPMEGVLGRDKVVRRTGGQRLDAGRPR